MTLQRVGVIADDLTGAADTTLAFWQHDFATFILLDGEDTTFLQSDAVITIDTDSRHAPLDECAARVTDAVSRLRTLGVTTFYKKIDSTLRGNLGTEIEATMRAANIPHAIICPAFPVMGRTVRDGRVLVQGEDLMQTPAANDPRSPVISSRIAEVIARQTTLPIEELCVSSAETDTAAQRTDMHITIIDAQTDEDLLKWVRYFGVGPDVLWVGAAGLADTLASELQKQKAVSQPATSTPAQTAAKPVLVVAGSVHTASRGQITILQESPDVTTVPIDPAQLVQGTLETAPIIQRVSDVLAQGKHCVIYTEHSPEVRERFKKVLDELHYTYEQGGGLIAQYLSKIVCTILSNIAQPVDLVLTGGDTAKPILARLHVSALRVINMVAPGTPISETLDGTRQVVTKAGGFGQPDILLQAVHALANHQTSTARA